jgi:hypothetical protein
MALDFINVATLRLIEEIFEVVINEDEPLDMYSTSPSCILYRGNCCCCVKLCIHLRPKMATSILVTSDEHVTLIRYVIHTSSCVDYLGRP